jgi:hypothetical protein
VNDRVDAVRVLGSHSGAQVGIDRDGFHAGLLVRWVAEGRKLD